MSESLLQRYTNDDHIIQESLRIEVANAFKHHNEMIVLYGSGQVDQEIVEAAGARLNRALEENSAYWNCL